MASAWLVGVFGLITVVTNVLLNWWLSRRDGDAMKRRLEGLLLRAQLLALLPDGLPSRRELEALLDDRVHGLVVAERRRAAFREALQELNSVKPRFALRMMLGSTLPVLLLFCAILAITLWAPSAAWVTWLEWVLSVLAVVPLVYGWYINVRHARWIRMKRRWRHKTLHAIRSEHPLRAAGDA